MNPKPPGERSEPAGNIMPCEVLQVDAASPASEAIARAAKILEAGGLVAFPTETVYGIAANALDPAAVAKIFAAKGRPAANPLIVHVDSNSMTPKSWSPIGRGWPKS